MRRKIVLLLVLSIVLLACTCSVPSIMPVLRTPTTSTPLPPTLTATSLPSSTSTPGVPLVEETATPSVVYVAVRLDPKNGGLMEQIGSEVQKAAAIGLKPFVEFDATW